MADALRDFNILRIGLNPDRKVLYERINHRAREMFTEGLMEETRKIAAEYPSAWALSSLGYKQAMQYLLGELSLEQAIEAAAGPVKLCLSAATWLRREPNVHWIAGFTDPVAERNRRFDRGASTEWLVRSVHLYSSVPVRFQRVCEKKLPAIEA